MPLNWPGNVASSPRLRGHRSLCIQHNSEEDVIFTIKEQLRNFDASVMNCTASNSLILTKKQYASILYCWKNIPYCLFWFILPGSSSSIPSDEESSMLVSRALLASLLLSSLGSLSAYSKRLRGVSHVKPLLEQVK